MKPLGFVRVADIGGTGNEIQGNPIQGVRVFLFLCSFLMTAKVETRASLQIRCPVPNQENQGRSEGDMTTGPTA